MRGDIKMKRLIIPLFCLAILLVGSAIFFISNYGGKEKIKEFSLNEYSDYIQRFPSDRKTDTVETAKMAKVEAEKIWVEIYGEQVKNRKPYNVFYDNKSGVWLIKGSLRNGEDGGVPYILIRKLDGRVLAVWHDK